MRGRRLLVVGIVVGSGCALAAPPVDHERAATKAIVASAMVPASSASGFEPVSDVEPTATADDPPAEPAPAGAPKKRIYSVGQTTWIRKKPEVKEGDFLGYVRTGSSVPIKSEKMVKGAGCPRGFYEVEPRGYVCADSTVTDAPREGFVRAADETRGTKGPFPYRYALSDGAPMYNRIPTAKEQARVEPKWASKPGVFHKLPKTLRAHEELATSDVIEATDEIPSFLKNGGSAKEGAYDLVEQKIPLGAMLSYTKAFKAEGRTWLLSADHTIVPADRVRPFKPSTFKGVSLVAGAPGAAKLPLAWLRTKPRPKLKKTGDGFEKTGHTWAARTYVELTGVEAEHQKKTYLETREKDGDATIWVSADDATVVTRETDRPMGVKERQKWFFIRLSQGTLVAYDDLEPVYATLISPGKGGLPVKGRDPVEDSTTPTGTFSITFKDKAATMSSEKGKDRSFWIQDVPHTQYFDPPFALHAAFWHERFGEYVSAGCVNLSPLDAEAMFQWSDPPVPAEWQGATGAGAKDNGQTTIVVIRR